MAVGLACSALSTALGRAGPVRGFSVLSTPAFDRCIKRAENQRTPAHGKLQRGAKQPFGQLWPTMEDDELQPAGNEWVTDRPTRTHSDWISYGISHPEFDDREGEGEGKIMGRIQS